MEICLINLICSAVYIISSIALGTYGIPLDVGDDESDWILSDRIFQSYSSSIPLGSSYSHYGDDSHSDVTDGGTGDDPSVESFKSLNRLSSLIQNTHSIRWHGFRKMDVDKDGYVTKHEYSLRNPDIDEEMVRTLFNVLDTDGDRKVAEEELLDHKDFWDTSEDCEVFAMQHCDGRLTYTVERGDDSTDSMCQGLQAYMDCLASESAFCDFTQDFVRAAYTFAESYKSTQLCEDLVIQELANFKEWDSSSKRKRRFLTDTADPEQGTDTLSCAASELGRCTIVFNRSLREQGSLCATLSQYRHCVNHAARNCNDETLENLKESIMVLSRLHKHFQVCDFQ